VAVGPAWLERRDPGLVKLRRAVRVATAASAGFYACRYGLGNPQLAVYALFSTFALGALSQLPGPRRRTATTLLWALPVAAGLVTLGSLAAVNLAVATAAIVVFGFLISFAGVGGPRAVGLAGGMQLMFILPDFPPYAPGMLPSRLGGIAVGIGLLVAAQLWLWPDPPPVDVKDRLAAACETLGALLTGRPTARSPQRLAAADRAAEAVRPQNLPLLARPASAGRRDRAFSHASTLLRYAHARVGELGERPPPGAARLLACAGQTVGAAAGALRGGPLPATTELATLVAEVRGDQRREPTGPEVHLTNLALVIGDAVWTATSAVRVALGGTVEGDRRRFGYAYTGPIRRYRRQFALHLTPRSVYFQQAVRVAVAFGAGRLIAGVLDLQHGFWVLLATLTLLRSRATDTRFTLRPAAVGTVTGAAAAAVLLLVVGNNKEVYAALLPPVLVVAVAASSVVGLGWGQAMFTLAITLVFSQVAPATVTLAEARVGNVLLGGGVGMAAGLLAWPRGAGGELRRTVAGLLTAAAGLVRQTASWSTSDSSVPVADRAADAMALAAASYDMYQAERHSPAESTVDWHGILVVGHEILRGSERLRAGNPPGALAQWRDLVETSANRVAGACGQLAEDIRRRRTPHVAPVDIPEAEDGRLVEMHDWLASIRDDLTRVA
jgi:uncharacterized membrane protein YccC